MLKEDNKLFFRISSALKDIIGKDLITDDYIAVFELVKNSYDAHATNVDIYFKNIYSENPTLTIIDNGKGMDIEDIKSRWLFVAYSAKKDGTEDESYDYRDRIYTKRVFAGAKGIGRFSCDRLGEILYVETKKNKPNSYTETLLTDWGKFETDTKNEFVDISIIYERKNSTSFNISHGTCLEISSLRSEWNREKLLKLKDSLAKLINPNQDLNRRNFVINLHVPEELEDDGKNEDKFDKVNGEVNNFIFETLGLKTTKIKCSISSNGEYVNTELIDGGTSIYKITEKNEFPLLNNIEFTFYYLNQSAKLTFAKKMGVNSVSYGHVFIYKNGFRIYPYGEPGEDSFGVDVRKAQGYSRYIGTRELLGQIEINSSDINLKETTSRGDGFIKSSTYESLAECFWEVIKKLEKYVVEVQQWGLSIEINEDSFGVRERISELLAKLSGSDSIINFEVPDNIIEILEASQVNSAITLSKNLNKIAFERKDDKLIEEAKKITDKIEIIQKAREEAEFQAKIQYKKAIEATKQLTDQISENLFLKSINTTEYQEVISLIHHIGIYAGTIDNKLKGISLRVQNNIQLSNAELYNIIRDISFETKKIINISSFATKANFKLSAEEIDTNLNEYVREYIQNIIPTTTDKNLNIKINNYTRNPFQKKIKPIEINIVIDNLIVNAKKAKAKNLIISISEVENELILSFKDDGIGIPSENLKRIYDFGFTTTDGSGLGLYHLKKIIESLSGSIDVFNNDDKGVTFTIKIKK
ncbi:sensor histidine kinase [Pedobacter cryophilus]|uniref:histidine kinase n=1 Tax=Pedobacter cryophilus TaxID=2571271 RepID=A0A4U1C630_9SPHI|nr:sensor histidine kinase [Pedobacter cryophilus]TKC00859.1 sensor histidine kinase [Pedobacter cryophilus]